MVSFKFSPIKLLLMLGLITSLVSCVKSDSFFSTKTGDSNKKAVVKFNDADEIIIRARDLDPAIEEFVLVTISRDPKSKTDLNQSLTVKLNLNPALLPAGYVELPAGSYTITPDISNIVFDPGEFNKDILITVDKSQLDLSKQYALGLSIAEVGSGAVISGSASDAIINVAIKNQYHGEYHATGIFHHPTAGDRPIDEVKAFNTAGANSVKAPLGDLGAAGYFMILTVNPDNTVTITPSGVTPNIDQHWGPNFYDPATKTFHLHYSYNVAAPRIVEETDVLL